MSYTSSARESRSRRLAALQKGNGTPGAGQRSAPNNFRGNHIPQGRPLSGGSGAVATSSSSPPSSPRGAYGYGGGGGGRAVPSPAKRRKQRSPNPPHYRKPPIVSPHVPLSPSRSWEEEPPNRSRAQSSYRRASSGTTTTTAAASSCDRSVSSEVVTAYTSSSERYHYRGRGRGGYSGSDRSVVSDSNLPHVNDDDDDDEVPMDEVAADLSSERASADRRPDPYRNAIVPLRNQTNHRRSSSGGLLPMGMCVTPAPDRKPSHPSQLVTDDDVSSLGGVEDQVPIMQRIAAAVRNRSARPSNLPPEARDLWDAVQSAIREARCEAPATSASDAGRCGGGDVGGGGGDGSANDGSAGSCQNWETRYAELKEQMDASRRESDHSLRAMRRVLADVTAERDKAQDSIKDLRDRMENQTKKNGDLQRDLEIKGKQLFALERELMKSREAQRQEMQALRKEKLELEKEVEAKDGQIAKLKVQAAQGKDGNDKEGKVEGTGNSGDTEVIVLRKELAEKCSALETSKMIIASLENASGSLATEMRAKLKAKEDEVSSLRLEAAERQKTLDTLATELRDLQRDQSKWNRSCGRGAERSARLALARRLEKNMGEVRAASVVLEATQDTSAIDKITDVLGESLSVLKSTIDTIEDGDGDGSDPGSVIARSGSFGSTSSRAEYDAALKDMRRELDEKTSELRRLEGALKMQRDELSKRKCDSDRAQKQKDDEVQALRAELQSLRDQCNTNMEVLMKKERALAVLRDSLKVDDDVGYISDDASDGDDDEEGEERKMLPSSSHQLNSSHYGPSQAEALATILAQGGSGFEVDIGGNNGGSNTEIESLKRELFKARKDYERAVRELKSEKESLANAKMIISSLEKANKSMMEDLRSRLQDSNTAIASLLEKSMEGEKTAVTLRAELEAVRREKAELQRVVGGQRLLAGVPAEEKKEEQVFLTETID